jgi:hypothetical protein
LLAEEDEFEFLEGVCVGAYGLRHGCGVVLLDGLLEWYICVCCQMSGGFMG